VISNRFFSGGPGEKIHSLHPFCRSKNAPKLPFCRLPDWAYEVKRYPLNPAAMSPVNLHVCYALFRKSPQKSVTFF
jgi:hypothetical protein